MSRRDGSAGYCSRMETRPAQKQRCERSRWAAPTAIESARANRQQISTNLDRNPVFVWLSGRRLRSIRPEPPNQPPPALAHSRSCRCAVAGQWLAVRPTPLSGSCMHAQPAADASPSHLPNRSIGAIAGARLPAIPGRDCLPPCARLAQCCLTDPVFMPASSLQNAGRRVRPLALVARGYAVLCFPWTRAPLTMTAYISHTASRRTFLLPKTATGGAGDAVSRPHVPTWSALLLAPCHQALPRTKVREGCCNSRISRPRP